MFREQDLIYTYCCFLLLSVSLFFEFSSSDMLRNNQLCIRVALLLWFVMSSRAIMVTSPSQGTTWSATGEHTVSWVEVNTDPTTFAISLVQLGVFKQILVPNVDGTQGSVTFSATLPTGSGFQVNIIKSAQDPDTILAQSPQIDITSSGSSSTSTSSPPPSTPLPSSSSSPNSSTSSSSTPASSTNGAPGSTSGSPPSITPSASSPASSGVSNGNSVNAPSVSPTTFTLITTPTSPTTVTSPNPGSSITSSATSSNSSTSSNSGATSSLVSLEPTSSGATRSFAVSASDAICFVLVLSNLWTLL